MKRLLFICLFAVFCISAYPYLDKIEWGFYGHRKINRLAVFTLPPEMIKFYKKNIEYVAEHAVDPDKRRYASKHEAVRHYIDIDVWGSFPFDNVPRKFNEALLKFADYQRISLSGDTTHLSIGCVGNSFCLMDGKDTVLQTDYTDFLHFFDSLVYPQYYEDSWFVDGKVVDSIFGINYFRKGRGKLNVEDKFSSQGILPYHLESMLKSLTFAFKDKDTKKILRLSAEFGHYISDAHVPLHTTVNYNGQLTDQIGIHAFWESRIPELFADNSYDFIVGKADYIPNPKSYFWKIILDSHSHLDSVLQIEKRLSKTFPSDKQYCYDERLVTTIRIQCPEYAEAYQVALKGMVEERMRASIIATGSVWYTAWINAGQPNLESIFVNDLEEDILEDSELKSSGKVRAHDN